MITGRHHSTELQIPPVYTRSFIRRIISSSVPDSNRSAAFSLFSFQRMSCVTEVSKTSKRAAAISFQGERDIEGVEGWMWRGSVPSSHNFDFFQ